MLGESAQSVRRDKSPIVKAGDEIQFLPEDEFREETVSRFLEWVLSAGFYILIFTLAVVLTAWLARFKLDSDVLNLKKQIMGKIQIMESASDFEVEFKVTQNKLSQLSNLQKETTPLKSEIFTALGKLIPQEVRLKDVSFTVKDFTLSAFSDSYSGVMTFLNGLKDDKDIFSEITLTSLFREEETGKITFGISGDIK